MIHIYLCVSVWCGRGAQKPAMMKSVIDDDVCQWKEVLVRWTDQTTTGREALWHGRPMLGADDPCPPRRAEQYHRTLGTQPAEAESWRRWQHCVGWIHARSCYWMIPSASQMILKSDPHRSCFLLPGASPPRWLCHPQVGEWCWWRWRPTDQHARLPVTVGGPMSSPRTSEAMDSHCYGPLPSLHNNQSIYLWKNKHFYKMNSGLQTWTQNLAKNARTSYMKWELKIILRTTVTSSQPYAVTSE